MSRPSARIIHQKMYSKMKYARIIPFIVLAAGLCSCTGKDSQKTAAAQTETTVQAATPVVAVITAQAEDVDQDAVYSTTIQANVINNIVPQAGARIRKINVEVGDFVTKGQVLAEMDRSNLTATELQLKNTKSEFERITALYKKGGVSQSDFESAEMALKVAENSYSNLLENTILRSPIDGVVSARGYDQGDMYAMQGPLFVVQQVSPVKMLVAVSERDYTKVKEGAAVTLRADAFQGETFQGKVSKVYPTVDAATHTVNVEVKVPNKDRRLRPGMYASARIVFGTNHSVVVPASAIIKQQGSGVKNAYVYNQDGSVSLRTVTLGRQLSDRVEILSGIEDGEKVVIKGQSALRNGIKVELAK